jgi:MYXO-CTERM domain-containing protein
MAQIVESSDRLQGDIDTGWIPACKPATSTGHCKDEKIQFRAQLAFDKIKTGGPIYTIDMKKGTKVDARWPDTDWIDLTLPSGGATDGTFKVAHTLTPEIALYIDTPVYTGEIKMDASVLINYLPNAQFNYTALNSTKFRPWAFDLVTLNVKGSDLNNSKLFGITFGQITDILGVNGIDDYVDGSFSFNATTDTDFKYQTTQVNISGATGPITYADGKTQVMSPDGDYLEVQGNTQGVLRYSGTIEFLPVININSIGGVGVSLNFPISVGMKYKFGSGAIPVSFPNELVHIPLPNVFVPSTPRNFGTVSTGSKSETQKVTIENSGELGALLEFSSSSSQFKIVGANAMELAPDGDSYDLEIRFQPTKSGKQTGKIIVKSNDPDTPTQEFNVTGYGEGADLPDPDPDPEEGTGGKGGGSSSSGSVYDNSSDDGGCGCRVPSQAQGSAAASLALLGLVAIGLRRRRR